LEGELVVIFKKDFKVSSSLKTFKSEKAFGS
jgi:hypothetical protein